LKQPRAHRALFITIVQFILAWEARSQFQASFLNLKNYKAQIISGLFYMYTSNLVVFPETW